MLEEAVDRDFVALYDVENARGQAGFLEKSGHVDSHRRIALAWFQHEGVAAGDGDGKHPGRDHAREVERRYAGDDPERLPQGPVVEAGGDLGGEGALSELRHA